MRSKRPPLPPAKPSAAGGNLWLLCSCGGRIVPQPRGKRFRYVGGESRFVVVDRTISIEALFDRLAGDCLAVSGRRRRPFAVKYQLPGVDLDSLITLATGEDLENMIAEYDRTPFPYCSHLRLFLFPTKNSRESSRSDDRVDNSSKGSENRFLGSDSPPPETSPEIPSPPMASTSSAIPILSFSRIPPSPVDFIDPFANAGPEIRRRQEDSSPTDASSPPEKLPLGYRGIKGKRSQLLKFPLF